MDFNDLVDWTFDALAQLGTRYPPRELEHVRTMYSILASRGEASTDHWVDWHKLAVKCAALLGETPPEAPSPAMLHEARKARKRALKAAVRPEAAKKKPSRRGAAAVVKRGAVPKRVAAVQHFEVGDEFRAGLAAIRGGAPLVFVTGRAGTGKSTFIRYVQRELAEQNIIVLAPTGIAALNAGGQTIHSFFRLPPKTLDNADVRELDEPSLVTRMNVLVIDEVSMVRADLLDAVDASLRLHRKSTAPFGGVQVVLVGDLFQLPPVVTRGEDADAMNARYASPFFFGAACLRGVNATAVELTHVHRQEDPRFIEILGTLRDGHDVREAVDALNDACAGRTPAGPHLILVTRNADAQRENEARLGALPGRPHTYAATRSGDFGEDRLPAPRELVLKVGAQVMFTRNDPEKRWVNGTTGIVEATKADHVRVVLDGGEVYEVRAETWENRRYFYDPHEKKIDAEVVGAYTQIPLMPAWAVTIHKAQGLTLERVHVDFGRGAFAEGQAYVALSRCRRIEDLTLTRPLRAHEVRASESIRAFYRRMRAAVPRVPMRVVAWDVRGARDIDVVVAALVAATPDVVALITDTETLQERLAASGFTQSRRNGATLVASRLPLHVGEIEFEGDDCVVVDVNGLTMIAAAFPGGEAKRAIWERLLTLASIDQPVLLAGNLNSGAHAVDEERSTMLCAEEFTRFGQQWTDLWRRCHGDAREFSWLTPRTSRLFRVDHAFASPSLVDRVTSCDYGHEPRLAGTTAHSMLIVDVNA